MVIAEVTLTEATKFGIDWQFLLEKNDKSFGSIGSNISVPTGNFPGGVLPNSEDEPSTPSSISGFTFNYLSGSLNALLNMIASTNDFTILARPSLLVRNNEEAYMNVGSNEPFLGSINRSGLNESVISQDVQYKDTGTTIKVTPRINDDGIINMKIEQELSQLGLTRTTENLQSFIQRKVSTSVVVRDGTAIVIGGLIDTRNKNDHQGIPVLKDIPVVGRTLFSSTDIEEVRTELVLIIVPQIVNPELSAKPLMAEFQRRMQLLYSIFNEEGIMFYETPLSDKTEAALSTPESTVN
jgi:general secretion pathway protein D